jgi:flagellar basal body rod protein FlgB
MDELAKTMAASASGMAAQAARLRLSTENIANADTPGYRRKTVSFEETFQRAGDARAVATGPVRLDESELVRIYDPTRSPTPARPTAPTRPTSACSTRQGRWRARCSTCCAADDQDPRWTSRQP